MSVSLFLCANSLMNELFRMILETSNEIGTPNNIQFLKLFQYVHRDRSLLFLGSTKKH